MGSGKRPDIPVEVIEVARWQPEQRVAERFQQGRAFLVGDAAHTMPPKEGLGAELTGLPGTRVLLTEALQRGPCSDRLCVEGRGRVSEIGEQRLDGVTQFPQPQGR